MKMPAKAKGIPKTVPPTPWRIFLTLAKINSLTLGGGYVIVPVTGNAFEKQGWIIVKNKFSRCCLFFCKKAGSFFFKDKATGGKELLL